MRRCLAGFALLLAACLPAGAAPLESVTYQVAEGTTLTAWLLRPEGEERHPAIVLLHGCGGLWVSGKNILTGRHRDWAERFAAAGYVVLLPDSFRSRGLESVCRDATRPVTTRRRVQDVAGAADWLAAQDFVDARRIGLMGWSHGGMTVLQSIAEGRAPRLADFKTAVAFYPGCDGFTGSRWQPRLPLTILAGEADDWASTEGCKGLAASRGFPMITYPDANHDFDAPNLAVRQMHGAAFSVHGDGVVTTGTNEPARQDAIKRVMAIFGAM